MDLVYRSRLKTRYHLAIDPGLKTNGFALYDRKLNSVEFFSIMKDGFKCRAAFMKTFPVAISNTDQLEFLLNDSKTILPLTVSIEVPHFDSFSNQLFGVVSGYLTWAHFKGFNYVMVNNRLPEYLLKKRSVSKTEVVSYAKKSIQDFNFTVNKDRINSHEADAFMQILFVNRNRLNKKYGMNIRSDRTNISFIFN